MTNWNAPLQLAILSLLLAWTPPAASAQSQSSKSEVEQLRQLVLNLEQRVAALEEQNRQLQHAGAPAYATGPQDAAALESASAELRGGPADAPESAQAAGPGTATSAPQLPGTLPGGTTLNYYFDGYYEYNFNAPIGRVNDLRAYDVLSNTFSLNQADFIFALDPDLDAHRRYGFRVDLQFGQATETLQGNPANEPRPEIYRNIFQAYGSYIVPAGHGIDIDFGKWASSLGIEGNYTKDQMNYTRSYYFYFLPFYHAGVRTSYKINDKWTANYWIDNGTNQSEPTNGYKDELFGWSATPVKSVNWIFNYYNGQEHPNTVQATICPVPVQPGLCESPVTPPPTGKTHIFDTYATWQPAQKLTLAGEADYFIQRQWTYSAPDHVDGGAVYAQYQLNARAFLAARGEYLSDRGGLFSNQTQALKEATATWKYSLADGFDAFLEYRRDWSNRPYFITSNPALIVNHQDTATMGLVWWYGGKQGTW